MNTNATGFRWFSKIFAFLCFEMKVASALEGLNSPMMSSKFNWESMRVFLVEVCVVRLARVGSSPWPLIDTIHQLS